MAPRIARSPSAGWGLRTSKTHIRSASASTPLRTRSSRERRGRVKIVSDWRPEALLFYLFEYFSVCVSPAICHLIRSREPVVQPNKKPPVIVTGAMYSVWPSHRDGMDLGPLGSGGHRSATEPRLGVGRIWRIADPCELPTTEDELAHPNDDDPIRHWSDLSRIDACFRRRRFIRRYERREAGHVFPTASPSEVRGLGEPRMRVVTSEF